MCAVMVLNVALSWRAPLATKLDADELELSVMLVLMSSMISTGLSGLRISEGLGSRRLPLQRWW